MRPSQYDVKRRESGLSTGIARMSKPRVRFSFSSETCKVIGLIIFCSCADKLLFRILCSGQSWRRCFQQFLQDVYIYCWDTSSVFSHSSEEAIFKWLRFMAWTDLTYRSVHGFFQNATVNLVLQRNRLLAIARENFWS